MHILYVDDSGSAGNPHERYFILAGVAVFERGIYHAIREVDDLVAGFSLDYPDDIELHGSPMYSGNRAPWRGIARRDRESLLSRSIDLIASLGKTVTLFSVAVEKRFISPDDPVTYAFEEISNRFNLFLQRIYQRKDEPQRGLIVMDESSHESTLQTLANEFRVNGTRWGNLRNIAEVPLFADSKATRLLQLADLVAYATWRRFEHKDGRFFDPLIPKFDSDGGVLHGLVHRNLDYQNCYCPACMSRRSD